MTEKKEYKISEELDIKKDFSIPTFEEWKEVAVNSLKGINYEEKLITKTYENIDLKPIYIKEDIADLHHIRELPGYGSYLRGTKENGFLKYGWEVAQNIPYAQPKEINEALIDDLQKGQNSINIRLDYFSALGLNPQKTEKEEDKGLSLTILKDLSDCFEDIDLKNYPIHIDAGYSAKSTIAALKALTEENKNTGLKNISGSVIADPITFLTLNGKIPVSLKKAYDDMAEVIKWLDEEESSMQTIGVNSYKLIDCGASIIDELSYAMAGIIEYIAEMVKREIPVNRVASSIKLNCGIGSFFFMEIAKLRAARMLFSRIVEAYGGDENAAKLKQFAISTTYNKTAYAPYVNMLRTTSESFSAIVGGADGICTHPFDIILGESDDFSRRIARNTQIILKEESHLGNLIDPGGGSFYIEFLTNEICQKVWGEVQNIEKQGGLTSYLKKGLMQEKISNTLKLRIKDINKRKQHIVGINMYTNLQEERIVKRISSKEYYEQKIKEFENFDTTKEKDLSINDMVKFWKSGYSIEAINSADNLEEQPEELSIKIEKKRATQNFEDLREATDNFFKKKGCRPKIFFANIGSIAQHKAREIFSKIFFEVAGFEVIGNLSFDCPLKAAQEVGKSCNMAIIYSTDDTYPELASKFAKEFKRLNPKGLLILEGYPKEQIETLKSEGVDEFVFIGTDTGSINKNLLIKAGILQ